jgi:hypothetical protein
MKVGDLVRLKKDHHLSEIFDGNCIIHEISNFPIASKKLARYHIKTITGELKWAWVYERELDEISEIRNDKLKELGI